MVLGCAASCVCYEQNRQLRSIFPLYSFAKDEQGNKAAKLNSY